ncbi:MAG: adenylate/guanylate cyclase domain-containing protein [Bacteroidia bacterium]|nr:adenylate/guanylate cyclase domain-containing protein [Bacteroidia bacterium]
MESTRKLAAIMFTDIQGYTALMQQDEAKALEMRNRHREVFQRLHKLYNGTILQYYGDGTLSVFDSAIDAAQCGVEMQKELQTEPKVPLRIGIHTGDILYSDTEAVGDGVNVASRVESVAVPGSVMISEKVYDYIKNQKEIPVQSMGHFNFKNVEKPLEVYALGLEGLVVPNPDTLSGKFVKHDAKGEADSSENASKKYTLPILIGGLLLAALAAVWALGGFGSGESENGVFTTIKVKDENGNTIERQIVRSSQQKKIYLVEFENETEEEDAEWLAAAIPFALEMDWDQDPYMLSYYEERETFEQFNAELEKAEEKRVEYLMRGNFSYKDSIYSFHPELYQVSSGQKIKEWDFSGPEILPLVDEASLTIKKDLGVPEDYLATVKDLPLTQQLTEDVDAFKKLIEGLVNMNKNFGRGLQLINEAGEEDESFAMANYINAIINHQMSFSPTLAEKSIERAMKHRKRLGESAETNVRILNYRIDNQPEKAVQLAKMMADMKPAQSDLQLSLSGEYQRLGMFEEALESVKRYQIARDDPDAALEAELNYLLRLGRTEEGIKRGEAFIKKNPEKLTVIKELGKHYLKAEAYEKAENLFKKADILEPESPYWSRFLDHIIFMKDSASYLTEDFLQKYMGEYEVEFRKLSLEIEVDAPILALRVQNQQDFPLYPISTNSYFASIQDLEIKFKKVLESEAEKLYLKEGQNGYMRCFKEDELIKGAHKLLAEKKYEEAKTKYTEAKASHPDHYYLDNFLMHIEFMLKKGDKWDKDMQAKYLGNYSNKDGNIKGSITQREDGIYLKQVNFPGTIEPAIILPMSEEKFMLPTSLASSIIFKKRGKKIKDLSLMIFDQKRGTLDKEE